MNEGTAKGFDFAKAPQRGTFRRRAAGARRESHLEFAGEVVSENAGEHVQLVSNPRLDRYVAHLAVRLELGKDSLLRPPSFVEENDLAWIGLVVGHDDLELVSIFDGLKQIELNGSFVLASDVFSDEDEAIAGVPRLRLPAGLEITEPARHGTPSSSAFDHFFETAKALERHRDGELGPQGVKSIDDGLVEERAVDTDLYLCPRQARAHGTHTVLDEGVGTVGVVDIAGPMMHIEHLVSLGDGAKQGVVAARTFLFLVEPHCRAFGMAPGAQHRPVEVERYARESFGHQALHDHSARLDSDFADALFIGPAERAADGGHVRQSLQAKHPFDHLVITIVVHVSQPSVSDDEMHDQQHHHHVVTVNRIGLHVAETSPQPFLDANEGEKVLKKNESRVRCEILRFESDIQTQSGFTTNIGSAMFHLRGLRFIWYFSVWQRLLYQSRRPHFFSLYTFSSQTTQYGFAEIHGHLCAWLNLTGGELDPHDTLVRMPYVLRGERVLE